jgi:hypothetical protein
MTDSEPTNRFGRHRKTSIVLLAVASSLATVFVAVGIWMLIFDEPPPLVLDSEARRERAHAEAQRLERKFRRLSPYYHHDLEPNRSVDGVRWGPLAYDLRTNSLGFKDRRVREVPLRSDLHRILLLGDSFTEGIGFAYEDTFAGRIAAALSSEGVEILNAGVASYAPSIYWRKARYLLEEVGLEFDEVVVFLDISDAQDDAESYYFDAEGNVKARRAHPAQMAELKQPKQPYGLGRRRGRWTVDEALFEEYGRRGLEKMDEYMTGLLALLHEHGISLTVAVYPWPEQVVAGDLDSHQSRYWRRWSEEHGVHFLDYFPVFVRGDTRGQRERALRRSYIAGDNHWNDQGHAIVAERFIDDYRMRRRAEGG